MKKLKLEMELIPKGQWYKSIYRTISKSKWNKIRLETIKKQKNKCAICDNNQGILYCHEFWEYDDKNNIQQLKGFQAICHACNSVKHFGKSKSLALQDKFDIEGVIQHFMEVNSCTREIFEIHKKESFEKWKKRSNKKWIIDFGKYDDIINE